jgi:hypothetical protein
MHHPNDAANVRPPKCDTTSTLTMADTRLGTANNVYQRTTRPVAFLVADDARRYPHSVRQPAAVLTLIRLNGLDVAL